MSKKKIIIYVFLLVIIVTGSYFAYKIYKTLSDNKKMEQEIIDIKEKVIIDVPADSSEDEKKEEDAPKYEKLTLDFKKLKEINSDTVAWIKISNTNIDYPVVQGKDNSYYLNHSFYKDNNINGWIYLNSDNNKDFTDNNTVIFGHNTNVNTMFSDVKDIYNGLLGSNIYINIYLENRILTYKVFSVYLEKPNNTVGISKYMNQAIIDSIKNKSIFNVDMDVTSEDNILTLSTCNNVTSDRLLLHAKML